MLLTSSSIGSAKVKILMAQAYMAFLEKNIITRHPAVIPRGPITAA